MGKTKRPSRYFGKKKFHSLLSRSRFSQPQLVTFIVIFALIGGYLLYRSFAAAPVLASVEAESMTLPGGSTVISDSSASANQAVKMTTSGTLTATVSLPAQASSFSVTARSDQCAGSPTVSVGLDGTGLLASTAVSSTSWTVFSATTNAASGSHKLDISGSNIGQVVKGKRVKCARNLYLDVSVFYGPVATPPVTITSFTANPATVNSGGASTLAWTTSNADSCTASGAWSGSQATNSTGTSTGPISTTSTYTLTCTGGGASATASVTVNVNASLSPCNLYIQPDGSDLSQTGTGSTAIRADVDNATSGRMYSPGQTVNMTFSTSASSSDTLSYQICNYQDQQVASGQFSVPSGSYSKTINWTPGQSGYYAVKAMLMGSKQFLPQVGSRPQGIMTFGVLPDTSSWTGFVTPQVPSPEKYRFGVQGTNALQSGTCCNGDMFQPMYSNLGVKWVNIDRHWFDMEPNYSGQYNPITDPSLVQPTPESKAGLVPYYIVDGIPGWESPTGSKTSQYAPKDWNLFQAYMTKVGQEAYAVRQKLYPSMQHSYFQVTWEPDPGTGDYWLSSAADFTKYYQYAYAGLHAGDPGAVVVGPTYSLLTYDYQDNSYTDGYGTGLQWLKNNGTTPYMDSLSTHGYWYGWGPPEAYPNGTNLSNYPANTTMRTIRSQMAQYLNAGARDMFTTEDSVGLPAGYAKNYPNLTDMQKSGAWLIRDHLMLLGEGAHNVFVFYTSDFPGTNSMGMTFNLDMANQPFGTGQVSPKVVGMAQSTLSRLIEGTYTLGYINNLSFDGTTPSVLGYSFQSYSSNQVVTALWAWGGATKCGSCSSWSAPFNGSGTYSLQVGASGTSGTVTVVDFMGNATSVPYSNGIATLNLTEYPTYVISNDPSAISSHITAPLNYSK